MLQMAIVRDYKRSCNTKKKITTHFSLSTSCIAHRVTLITLITARGDVSSVPQAPYTCTGSTRVRNFAPSFSNYYEKNPISLVQLIPAHGVQQSSKHFASLFNQPAPPQRRMYVHIIRLSKVLIITANQLVELISANYRRSPFYNCLNLRTYMYKICREDITNFFPLKKWKIHLGMFFLFK